eukprot:gnl/Chilomastix_cuspidata/827.p1 GENE.gnl/Chilomastix_cuspidata/827~~gnl/Chilomastix_cuspidata/827.p1  ORF type:complete len:1552 (-),score=554.99 gnl/Chilomastix_cuspidata/827:452-5107(-)
MRRMRSSRVTSAREFGLIRRTDILVWPEPDHMFLRWLEKQRLLSLNPEDANVVDLFPIQIQRDICLSSIQHIAKTPTFYQGITSDKSLHWFLSLIGQGFNLPIRDISATEASLHIYSQWLLTVDAPLPIQQNYYRFCRIMLEHISLIFSFRNMESVGCWDEELAPLSDDKDREGTVGGFFDMHVATCETALQLLVSVARRLMYGSQHKADESQRLNQRDGRNSGQQFSPPTIQEDLPDDLPEKIIRILIGVADCFLHHTTFAQSHSARKFSQKLQMPAVSACLETIILSHRHDSSIWELVQHFFQHWVVGPNARAVIPQVAKLLLGLTRCLCPQIYPNAPDSSTASSSLVVRWSDSSTSVFNISLDHVAFLWNRVFYLLQEPSLLQAPETHHLLITSLTPLINYMMSIPLSEQRRRGSSVSLPDGPSSGNPQDSLLAVNPAFTCPVPTAIAMLVLFGPRLIRSCLRVECASRILEDGTLVRSWLKKPNRPPMKKEAGVWKTCEVQPDFEKFVEGTSAAVSLLCRIVSYSVGDPIPEKTQALCVSAILNVVSSGCPEIVSAVLREFTPVVKTNHKFLRSGHILATVVPLAISAINVFGNSQPAYIKLEEDVWLSPLANPEAIAGAISFLRAVLPCLFASKEHPFQILRKRLLTVVMEAIPELATSGLFYHPRRKKAHDLTASRHHDSLDQLMILNCKNLVELASEMLIYYSRAPVSLAEARDVFAQFISVLNSLKFGVAGFPVEKGIMSRLPRHFKPIDPFAESIGDRPGYNMPRWPQTVCMTIVKKFSSFLRSLSNFEEKIAKMPEEKAFSPQPAASPRASPGDMDPYTRLPFVRATAHFEKSSASPPSSNPEFCSFSLHLLNELVDLVCFLFGDTDNYARAAAKPYARATSQETLAVEALALVNHLLSFNSVRCDFCFGIKEQRFKRLSGLCAQLLSFDAPMHCVTLPPLPKRGATSETLLSPSRLSLAKKSLSRKNSAKFQKAQAGPSLIRSNGSPPDAMASSRTLEAQPKHETDPEMLQRILPDLPSNVGAAGKGLQFSLGGIAKLLAVHLLYGILIDRSFLFGVMNPYKTFEPEISEQIRRAGHVVINRTTLFSPLLSRVSSGELFKLEFSLFLRNVMAKTLWNIKILTSTDAEMQRKKEWKEEAERSLVEPPFPLSPGDRTPSGEDSVEEPPRRAALAISRCFEGIRHLLSASADPRFGFDAIPRFFDATFPLPNEFYASAFGPTMLSSLVRAQVPLCMLSASLLVAACARKPVRFPAAERRQPNAAKIFKKFGIPTPFPTLPGLFLAGANNMSARGAATGARQIAWSVERPIVENALPSFDTSFLFSTAKMAITFLRHSYGKDVEGALRKTGMGSLSTHFFGLIDRVGTPQPLSRDMIERLDLAEISDTQFLLFANRDLVNVFSFLVPGLQPRKTARIQALAKIPLLVVWTDVDPLDVDAIARTLGGLLPANTVVLVRFVESVGRAQILRVLAPPGAASLAVAEGMLLSTAELVEKCVEIALLAEPVEKRFRMFLERKRIFSYWNLAATSQQGFAKPWMALKAGF